MVFPQSLKGIAALFLIAKCGVALTPKMQTIKDISVGVGEQLPSGWVGLGARSQAMGGTLAASTIDGTALFAN
ncbi:MAG TPA: hypothetical protein PLT86_10100, partial [Candidatus Latescibacteria bacterium]|nr:hypothetical protein [Candidatus Latescibacterota bacterium]